MRDSGVPHTALTAALIRVIFAATLGMVGALTPWETQASDCGIFVAPTGGDGPTCGLSPDDPCLTVNHGMARADSESLGCVFIGAGTYAEILAMRPGIHLRGGFDSGWHPGPADSLPFRALIIGGFDAVTGQYLTVRARDLAAAAELSDLVLQGPVASGTVSGNGRGSYALYARNSTLRLTRVRLVGGTGADGSAGTPGTDALVLDRQSYMNAGAGGPGMEFTTLCDSDSRGTAGSAGSNSCSGGSSSQGGAGGAGGTMDTSCRVFPPGCDNCTARPGLPGANGGQAGGAFGLGGAGGSGGAACSVPPGGSGVSGTPGRVSNGLGGSGGTDIFVAAEFWYARGGGAGGVGDNGGGGGGGGGSGGCDEGTDAYGAGGGGGGAGGCRAIAGGSGGGGGGLSVAVGAYLSSVDLVDCTIDRGSGGRGGDGGVGGRGQSRGLGAPGGAHPGTGTPGLGGDGGHGGHAGGGGGGRGGDAIGILLCNSIVTTSGIGYAGGAAGIGGSGGASAPGAPVDERDGLPGASGANGAVWTSVTECDALARLPQSPATSHALLGAPCDPSPCTTTDVAASPGEVSIGPGTFLVAPVPAADRIDIRMSPPSAGHMTLEVFDARGSRLRVLHRGPIATGPQSFAWDGRTDRGSQVSPGIYFLRASIGDWTAVRRVSIVR